MTVFVCGVVDAEFFPDCFICGQYDRLCDVCNPVRYMEVCGTCSARELPQVAVCGSFI